MEAELERRRKRRVGFHVLGKGNHLRIQKIRDSNIELHNKFKTPMFETNPALDSRSRCNCGFAYLKFCH